MQSDYRAYQQTEHFGSLDGLRCLSILGVVWSHTGALAFEEVTLLSRGWLGVQLFFAISGFLITTLLLRERRRNGSIALKNFYMRRTLRIFPLYYTVLLVYVLLVWKIEGASDRGRLFWSNLPYFLTYTSNWFVGTGSLVIFSFAWSLAAEEQFYLLWPSVEKHGRTWQPVALAIGLIALAQTVRPGLLGAWLPSGSLACQIIACIQEPICLGVLLAHVLDSPHGYAIARRLVGSRWAAPAALAAFLVAAAWAGTPLLVLCLLLAVLLAACVVREDHLLAPFLRWRPVAYLGTISYGMYLMQAIPFAFLKSVFGEGILHRPFLAFPATVLATTIAAGLSFRYYERFFLQLKSRFASQRSAEPGPIPGDLQEELGPEADLSETLETADMARL